KYHTKYKRDAYNSQTKREMTAMEIEIDYILGRLPTDQEIYDISIQYTEKKDKTEKKEQEAKEAAQMVREILGQLGVTEKEVEEGWKFYRQSVRQNSEEKAQPSGVLVQAVWKTDETPNTLIGISLSQFFKTHP